MKKHTLICIQIALSILVITACDDKDDKLDNGMICISPDDCKSHYCVDKVCVSEEAANRLPNGSACENNSECKSNYCDQTQHQCANAPSIIKKEIGDICANNDECLSEYCSPTTQKCAPKPAPTYVEVDKEENGASCVFDFGCISEHCNPYLGICVSEADMKKKIPTGNNCVASSYCESNLCEKGKCIEIPGSNGSSCKEHNECDSFYCNDSHRCEVMPPQPNGSECLLHIDCLSGYCSEGYPGICETPVQSICSSDADCEAIGPGYACTKSLDNDSIILCRKLKVGESCRTHEQCESGMCLPNSKRCGITDFGQFRCKKEEDCASKGVGLHCDIAYGYCTINDPCETANCKEDELCALGKCVKDWEIGAPCSGDSIDFCVVNYAVICDKGTIKEINCNENGLGYCTVVNGKVSCVGGHHSWGKCYTSLIDYNTTKTTACTTTYTGTFKANCAEDANGWLVSVPESDISLCESGKLCNYDPNNNYNARCE